MTLPIKVGFFSFVEVPDPSEHGAYNEWHQLDHLPSQYAIPGIAFGDRWVLTPRCRAAQLACSDHLAPVQYVALYLMTDPIEQTLTDFVELGHRLGNLGRFHRSRATRLFGGLQFLATYASPDVLIAPEVLPYRPAAGVYVIVEEVDEPRTLDGWLQLTHVARIARLLDIAGVAGISLFATSQLYTDPGWSPGRYRITVCWLSKDPATVAHDIAGAIADNWGDDAPLHPVFAAALETIRPGEWSWFDPA